MPNFSTHCKAGLLTGAGCGLIIAIIDQKDTENFDWSKVLKYTLSGALGGLAGSILLDVFEPAIHPNHRGLAHSALVGGGLSVKVINNESSQSQNIESVVLISFAAGYLSHLFLDGKTAKGLPLLC